MLLEIEAACRPLRLEPGGLVQTRPVPVWVWGWLEASSFIQMLPSLEASTCPWQVGAMLLGLGLEARPFRTPKLWHWMSAHAPPLNPKP